MIYSSTQDGGANLALTPQEHQQLKLGEKVERSIGYGYGVSKIVLSIDIPADRHKRFPESVYGKDFVPQIPKIGSKVLFVEDISAEDEGQASIYIERGVMAKLVAVADWPYDGNETKCMAFDSLSDMDTVRKGERFIIPASQTFVITKL